MEMDLLVMTVALALGVVTAVHASGGAKRVPVRIRSREDRRRRRP